MSEEVCEFCGRPAHGPGNYIPRTREEYARHGLHWVDDSVVEYGSGTYAIPPPMIQTVRQAFHGSVSPLLQEDPTFVGNGHTYTMEADFVETVNDAVSLAFGEGDLSFEDPQPFDIFAQLAGDTDRTLVGFYVASMTSSRTMG